MRNQLSHRRRFEERIVSRLVRGCFSTHDYDLANQAGAAFRADANLALAAILSLNSNLTAPATTVAGMLWYDTTLGIVKQRNAANSAWINRFTVANAEGNFTIGSGAGTAETQTTNSGNVATADARHSVTVGGTSAGDPYFYLAISGSTTFSAGLDNSDSDKLKEVFNNTIGSGNEHRIVTSAGEQTLPKQPAFLAYNSAVDTDVTGDSTVYTVVCDTEVFDQNSDYNNATGVFTAPVTGRYQINFSALLTGMGTAHTEWDLTIVTSNRNYSVYYIMPAATGLAQKGQALSHLVDMDAADTATFQVTAFNSTKTADLYGGTTMYTAVSGFLAC